MSINQNPRFVYAEHFWWPLYSLVPLPSSRSLRSPSSPLLPPPDCRGFTLWPARVPVVPPSCSTTGNSRAFRCTRNSASRNPGYMERRTSRHATTRASAAYEGIGQAGRDQAFLSRARISDELCLNFLLGIEKIPTWPVKNDSRGGVECPALLPLFSLSD